MFSSITSAVETHCGKYASIPLHLAVCVFSPSLSQLQLEGKKKKKKKKPLVDLTTGEVKPASEQAPPPTVEAPPTTTISDGGQGQESGVGATTTGTSAPAVTMDDDLGESCDYHVIVT